MNKRREYHKQWRNENREHVNRYSKEYNEQNDEQRKMTNKRYRKRVKTDQEIFLNSLFRAARNNAKSRNIEFNISIELVRAFILVQNNRCALTGIQFIYEHDGMTRARPFAPSIDRKDNSRGYTCDNIHLVCCIVNRAKNEFPQIIFDQMCLARVRQLYG